MVEVAGHTDSIGSDDVNQSLSEQRANAVAQYLIAQGLNPQRFIVVGAGKASARMAEAVAADPYAPIRARVAAVCHLHRRRWGLPRWLPDERRVQRGYARRGGHA